MEDTNRCVCCGEIIPEGRWVCPRCERDACLHLWIFDGIEPAKDGKMLRYRCQKCGATRTDSEKARLEILGEYQ